MIPWYNSITYGLISIVVFYEIISFELNIYRAMNCVNVKQ